MDLDKRKELLKLGKKRRETQWSGYKGIGDFHDGIYECDFVSPYTKSAGSVDADIMVLLQDWSSEGRLSGPVDEGSRILGYSSRIPTNINLKKLLKEHFDLELSEVFATNLFPLIKSGHMSAAIPQKDYVRAAHEFAIPQIKIVNPRIAVCLGKSVFNSLRLACGLKKISMMDDAIGSPFMIESTLVWCLAHTGTLGTNNRNKGGIDRVNGDWARMASEYRRLR